MRKALIEWYGRWHGPSLHQDSPRRDTTCGMFVNWKEMMDTAEESADKNLEMGAPLLEHEDTFPLGTMVTGSRFNVRVPRPKKSAGTFHTHPFGSLTPSGRDIVEMMSHDDKVMCIGRSGYIKTYLNCFIPQGDAEWVKMETKVEGYRQRAGAFNDEMRTKYPDKLGFALRSHLFQEDLENWKRLVSLENERHRIWREASRLTYPDKPYPAMCSWERDVDKYIRGIVPEEEEEQL